MLCQFVASVFIGVLCLRACLPDVFIDTTGAPFMYPLAKLSGCRVMAYIHYPIISTDMLSRVREMRPSYNNDSRIASNASMSLVKLTYYRALAALFSATGYCVDMAFVNSSWTEEHMQRMWKGAIQCSTGRGLLSVLRLGPGRLVKLFPPCNTSHLLTIPLGMSGPIPASGGTQQQPQRERIILSVGQFRPEKDHFLQISAFKRLLVDDRTGRFSDVRLVLLGSSRNADDERLLGQLRSHAAKMGVDSAVDFVVNAPFDRLEEYLTNASVGLHTMWNEHFGISVVEMMAAGLLVIAHNSGGPAMDILQSFHGMETGYLASTEEEYAEKMACALDILAKDDGTRGSLIRQNGRDSIDRFSDEAFSTRVVALMRNSSCFRVNAVERLITLANLRSRRLPSQLDDVLFRRYNRYFRNDITVDIAIDAEDIKRTVNAQSSAIISTNENLTFFLFQ